MRSGKSERLHLVHGFFGRPALLGHAIGSHCHSRAIVGQTAMHEHFLAGLVLNEL
jgi:hypothetical protein